MADGEKAMSGQASDPGSDTVSVPHPSALPSDELPADAILADRYEIRSQLGRGGFAVVYLAWDRELRQEVALKLLRTDRLTDIGLGRFRREAAIAREVQSEYLVRIYDFGRAGQHVYLTMEVVEGESLEDVLHRGALPMARAVEIAQATMTALSDLHRAGVLHRDVKPANVLLGADGAIKLGDFGLARHWDREETRHTASALVVGTVEYLAPEQVLGEETDQQSDLYSFGIILFEMLAGRPPHEAGSSLGSMLAHLKNRAPDVRRYNPGVPRWLARVVDRLLERQPADRYLSADEVLEDLKSHRAPRFLTPSRKRALGMASAAAVVIALATTGLMAWMPGRQTAGTVHVTKTMDHRLRGVDSEGHILWERSDVNADFVMARLEAGAPRRLVGTIQTPYDNHSQSSYNELQILDPDTGRTLRTVTLPSAHRSFSDFSNAYGIGGVHAIDLDHDGVDEVLVTYTHTPYWPCFSVLYEPRIQRARIIFIASGHHRFVGAADLNGDGQLELLFLGFNNLMGWQPALAAVRLTPAPDKSPEVSASRFAAVTPDTNRQEAGVGDLLWYTLLPRSVHLLSPDQIPKMVQIKAKEKTISLRGSLGETVVVGFDGFIRDSLHSGPDDGERGEARRQAYAALREATRLDKQALFDDARGQSEIAIKEAGISGDRLLRDWATRIDASIRIHAGDVIGGNRELKQLVQQAQAAPEIAFEAGRDLYLAGRPELALPWFRRGLGPGAVQGIGRTKRDYLEGIIFCLDALGEVDEGVQETEAFARTYPMLWDSVSGQVFAEWLRWRHGETPHANVEALDSQDESFLKYLAMEFRHAGGNNSENLLRQALNAESRSPHLVPLLQSLEADILDATGHPREALDKAQRAWDGVLSNRDEEMEIRAHTDLVAQRLERIAAELGDNGLRTSVEAKLTSLHRESGHIG